MVIGIFAYGIELFPVPGDGGLTGMKACLKGGDFIVFYGYKADIARQGFEGDQVATGYCGYAKGALDATV
jgi:hypothetical protein